MLYNVVKYQCLTVIRSEQKWRVLQNNGGGLQNDGGWLSVTPGVGLPTPRQTVWLRNVTVVTQLNAKLSQFAIWITLLATMEVAPVLQCLV
jgi:hypothetical protein